MAGSLFIVDPWAPAGKHDHVDIRTRLTARSCAFATRAASALCHLEPGIRSRHPLLRKLGPEPLSDGFDGAHLQAAARGRKIAVKPFIMNASIVVGVGNIYASEVAVPCRHQPEACRGRVSRGIALVHSPTLSRTSSRAPSKRAVPRCAISTAVTANRDTSNKSWKCMAVTANPAGDATRTSRSSSWDSDQRFTVSAASAERGRTRRQIRPGRSAQAEPA